MEKNNDNKKKESLGQTLGWQITQIPELLNYDLQSWAIYSTALNL